MKKLLTVLLMVLSFSAFSMSSDGIRSKVVCVEGYKFLYVWYVNGSVISVTQILRRGKYNDNPSLPMRCK